MGRVQESHQGELQWHPLLQSQEECSYQKPEKEGTVWRRAGRQQTSGKGTQLAQDDPYLEGIWVKSTLPSAFL